MSNDRAAWTDAYTKQQMAASLEKKRSKYGATKVEHEGQIFDSKREFNRWRELQLREKAGEIKDLVRQVDFALKVFDAILGCYRADFEYHERQGTNWVRVVEDSKGVRTALYRWKAKHFKAQYGFAIRET